MKELACIEEYAVSGGEVIYNLNGTCYEVALTDKILIVGTALIGTSVFVGKKALGISTSKAVLYGLGIQALSLAYMEYIAPKRLCDLELTCTTSLAEDS